MFFQKRKTQQLTGLGLSEVVARCREKSRELDRLRGSGFRGVPVVIQRNINLAKPINLLAGFLILMLGIGIGYWSRDQDSPQVASESYGHRGYPDQIVERDGKTELIIPGAVEEAEAVVAPALSAPVVSPAIGKDSAVRHSSQDTLLQKVRELLERVKRGK